MLRIPFSQKLCSENILVRYAIIICPFYSSIICMCITVVINNFKHLVINNIWSKHSLWNERLWKLKMSFRKTCRTWDEWSATGCWNTIQRANHNFRDWCCHLVKNYFWPAGHHHTRSNPHPLVFNVPSPSSLLFLAAGHYFLAKILFFSERQQR
jgi:hypothetical protein